MAVIPAKTAICPGTATFGVGARCHKPAEGGGDGQPSSPSFQRLRSWRGAAALPVSVPAHWNGPRAQLFALAASRGRLRRRDAPRANRAGSEDVVVGKESSRRRAGSDGSEGLSRDAQGYRSTRTNQASRWGHVERSRGVRRLEAEIGDEDGCGLHEGPIVGEGVDEGVAAGCRRGLPGHARITPQNPSAGGRAAQLREIAKLFD